MRRLILSIGFVVAAALPGQANAQTISPSGGELGPVLSCVYECKPGSTIRGRASFQAITTLMLTNPSSQNISANLVIHDGNQNVIALGFLSFSPEDLDEVNICHTLYLNGIQPPPKAGIAELVFSNEIGGVYGWAKSLIGQFRVSIPEPFAGRVTGLAKSQCRVAPVPDVANPAEIQAKTFEAVLSGQAIILDDPPPILVERTDDEALD